MKFLTGGIPASTPKPSSSAGVQRALEVGLGGMELEFVRGVRMSEALADEVRAIVQEKGAILTCHAPYYINLNSQEEEKVVASIERILQSGRIASRAGAQKLTFHPAFYHEMEGEEVYQKVKKECEKIAQIAREEGWELQICPETTGKPSQFGSLEELLRLAKEIPGWGICIDFAHICARTNGRMNGEEATENILGHVEKWLGKAAWKNIYAHISGIEWGEKGERNHLMIDDPGNQFDARGCLRALKKHDCEGIITCESPDPEADALLLQKYWEGL